MDKFYQIAVSLAVLVIKRGNLSEPPPNGLNVICTSPPFYTIHTVGYIQCQRACYCRSECGWMRYVKNKLVCSMFFDGTCNAGPEQVEYTRRMDISENNGGPCYGNDCPADHTYVTLSSGISTCLPDQESQFARQNQSGFVHFDGMIFVPLRKPSSRNMAAATCMSLSGHLAVIDTMRKFDVMNTTVSDLPTSASWWLRGLYFGSGPFIWYPEETVTDTDQTCLLFRLGTGFMYGPCSFTFYFVCEL